MTMTYPTPPGALNQPAEQQQEQPTPAINADTVDLPEEPVPAHQPMPHLPQPQLVQPLPAPHQTRSGRVIQNTPCYEQSISKKNQGLIAWEVLLDQDEWEDVPTATSQYAIQKAL